MMNNRYLVSYNVGMAAFEVCRRQTSCLSQCCFKEAKVRQHWFKTCRACNVAHCIWRHWLLCKISITALFLSRRRSRTFGLSAGFPSFIDLQVSYPWGPSTGLVTWLGLFTTHLCISPFFTVAGRSALAVWDTSMWPQNEVDSWALCLWMQLHNMRG